MATINPFISSQAPLEKRKRPLFDSALNRAAMAIGRSWRAYLSYKRLNRLNDQALAARGLRRRDIGRRVFIDNLD